MTAMALALLGLLAASPAVDVGAPRGSPLSGPELDKCTEEASALLRCPVCQGLSVADSPSTMARNMKAEVRQKLAEGYDQEQVLAYFERSYGEFVRLQPQLRGVNWLVWLAPLAALLAGAAVVRVAMKRARAATSAPPDLPSRDTLPGDPLLAAAVGRVRQLAYGWPGGVPPDSPTKGP